MFTCLCWDGVWMTVTIEHCWSVSGQWWSVDVFCRRSRWDDVWECSRVRWQYTTWWRSRFWDSTRTTWSRTYSPLHEDDWLGWESSGHDDHTGLWHHHHHYLLVWVMSTLTITFHCQSGHHSHCCIVKLICSLFVAWPQSHTSKSHLVITPSWYTWSLVHSTLM